MFKEAFRSIYRQAKDSHHAGIASADGASWRKKPEFLN